ncbi:9664_t:CDS:10 [Ambispora gerdemannii]|uniref:9664_t:CDS:1 n=1 Tax=Ambispora gerdemannii TaxID=144530 RepID=A0A9N9FSB6_9GLOM|nr:9664_t:CDS:10 [Ambispora gerdemannii]
MEAKRKRRGRTFRVRCHREKSSSNLLRGEIITDANWKEFVVWLKSNGFPKTKLTLGNFQGIGRGLMATKEIKAGEVIISVPKKFLLTREMVITELDNMFLKLGCSLKHNNDNISACQAIALYLALQKYRQQKRKNSCSFFSSYLKLLPKNFCSLPFFFDTNLFELLPKVMKDDVQRQRQKFEYDYNNVKSYLKTNNSNCTRDNIAVAPMLDFLNHSSKAKIKGEYNNSSNCYEITTFTPYKKGEQAFINYGPHDDFFILIEYGFVLSNNPYNYVSVDHEFSTLSIPNETIAAKEEKFNFLLSQGFFGDYTLRFSEISFRLLTALRFRIQNQQLAFTCADDTSSTFSSTATQRQHRPYQQTIIKKWKSLVNGQMEHVDSENEQLVKVYLMRICEFAIKEAKDTLKILEKYDPNNLSILHVKQIWQESIGIVESYGYFPKTPRYFCL